MNSLVKRYEEISKENEKLVDQLKLVAKNLPSLMPEQPNSTTRRGRVGRQVAQTLTTQPEQAVVEPSVKIRKLTPRECGRLMGVLDEDIDKMKKSQSDSSLYHLFGDAIAVPVLMSIFGEILDVDYETKRKECIEELCSHTSEKK